MSIALRRFGVNESAESRDFRVMLPKGPQAQNRRLVNTVGLHFNGLAHKAESNPPGALSTMMPKGVDFGIIGFLTILNEIGRSVTRLCSTPFGIIGILTSVRRCNCWSRFVGCSTPFGIIGILTPVYYAGVWSHSECAQRLSASSDFSPF